MSKCELLKEAEEERDLYQKEARNHKALLDALAEVLKRPDEYALSNSDILTRVKALVEREGVDE